MGHENDCREKRQGISQQYVRRIEEKRSLRIHEGVTSCRYHAIKINVKI